MQRPEDPTTCLFSGLAESGQRDGSSLSGPVIGLLLSSVIVGSTCSNG